MNWSFDLSQAPRVYLDLDGVMADFDAHFPALFGVDHRHMLDDDMWAQINSHPSYFRDMPVCQGAVEFFRSVEALNPIILTACPKSNYAHAARQKREWVREHLGTNVTVLPVMGGSNKPLFMHAKGDILIDDFDRNTIAWVKAGGTAILHRSFAQTAISLGMALNQKSSLSDLEYVTKIANQVAAETDIPEVADRQTPCGGCAAGVYAYGAVENGIRMFGGYISQDDALKDAPMCKTDGSHICFGARDFIMASKFPISREDRLSMLEIDPEVAGHWDEADVGSGR